MEIGKTTKELGGGGMKVFMKEMENAVGHLVF